MGVSNTRSVWSIDAVHQTGLDKSWWMVNSNIYASIERFEPSPIFCFYENYARPPSTRRTRPYRVTSTMRHCQPESWLSKGRLRVEHQHMIPQKHKEGKPTTTHLAPKHQPSSFPLIFFAILTSRSNGMS